MLHRPAQHADIPQPCAPDLSPTLRKPSFRPALLAAAAVLALGAGCSGSDYKAQPAAAAPPPPPAPKYAAEIRRTAFGVPHIKADNEGSIGFGVAYAYAQDNICQFADEITTVNGERSRFFGAAALRTASALPNLQTDYFYRLINEADIVAAAWQSQPAPMKALVEGYVAGYNHYLDQTGAAALPADCRNAAWVRKIGTADMMKLLRRYAAEGGAGQFIGAMVGAVPPGAAASSAPAQVPAPAANPMHPEFWQQMREQTGSNAVALGKDATENGQGMLLGNPHFPWQGSLRFYQLHVTIPGKLDAMGAALGGMPLVNIGFNQDLAWSHTVNTSAHFTVHALQLDPASPTSYLVDGQRQAMVKKTVSVEVRGADGALTTQSRDFWSSQYGPLITIPGTLAWTGATAYALRDANLFNHRLLEQWHAMNGARSLDEFKASIDRIVGLPWVNTLAVDKAGSALYMDVTVVPNVSAAKQQSCIAAPFRPLTASGIYVLNGAAAACMPDDDAAAPQKGIFAGASLPRLVRSDYVQNSNDSAWMSNPEAPLTGFPAIVSTDGTELSPRTRLGIGQLRARLNGTDGLPGKKMSMAQLQSIVLNNKVFTADLAMGAVTALCSGDKAMTASDGTSLDASGACALLASWDRSANLDANMGYVYFTGFWDRIGTGSAVWNQPFNPADPVNTPNGLNVGDPARVAALRAALATSVLDANRRGVAPAAKWGELQSALRGAKKIGIHGGNGKYGVYNAITSTLAADGTRAVTHGTSYIQTVMFDSAGPQAHAMLSYSQSSDPASPHVADQTERFAQKAWVVQPFTEAQIKADPAYKTSSVSQQ